VTIGSDAALCPVPTGDKVRYVGDPIAIVVAETVDAVKIPRLPARGGTRHGL
jgi:CO/xanthine dehydrogenase Mo-binding subunit